jgi:hypothetical protein
VFGNAGALIAIAPRLAELLRAALDHYAQCKAAGVRVDADVLATFIDFQTERWDPVVNGKHILSDPETRVAGCRFLAGIAYKLAGGE